MDNDLDFIKSILSDEIVTEGFPLVYKGELNHQILKLFTKMAENKIMKSKKEDSVRRKLFHVMVECLENITKHSDAVDDDNKKIGNGVFVVGEKEEYYYVITGNKIESDKVSSLKERIDSLNLLSKEELTEAHKKQIVEGKLSAKGGAGLGLIDILRKTGQQLKYDFVPLDDDYHFFIFKVTVVN
jgi:hypothetical protein